jgi:hypothetical protein
MPGSILTRHAGLEWWTHSKEDYPLDPLQFFIDNTGKAPGTTIPSTSTEASPPAFGDVLQQELAKPQHSDPKPPRGSASSGPHSNVTRYGFYRAPLEAPAQMAAAPSGDPDMQDLQVLGEEPQQPIVSTETPQAIHPQVTRYGFYRAPLEDPRVTSPHHADQPPDGGTTAP